MKGPVGVEPPSFQTDRSRSNWDRSRVVLPLDGLILTLSFVLAALLRFEFALPQQVRISIGLFLAIAVPIRLVVFAIAGVYRAIHRYSGITDLLTLAGAMAVGNVVVGVAGHLVAKPVPMIRIPLSVLAIDFFIGTAFLAAGRLAYSRLARRQGGNGNGKRRRTVIVGAGSAGSLLATHLHANPGLARKLVGFVDDAVAKHGKSINGVPIIGSRSDLPRLIDQHAVEEVIFGIPSARGELLRETLDLCRGRVSFRTVPGLLELGAGRGTATHLREVRVEDLLRRAPVEFGSSDVTRLIAGRVCLVTGGGGSIGSELCRQIAALAPSKLVILERFENNLYEIHHELAARFPELEIRPVVGDCGDRWMLDHLLKNEQPHVVFHAAAHKHVPLMQDNALEAIRNNVFGTRTLVESAERHGVEEFVLISTDKAVRPKSVMGATKRLAETIVQSRNGFSATRFVTVRFGNVLNSAGSVVPRFTRQIEAGGPVTVTHPDVQRYFMTIFEAAQLVIQAGALGRGGEVFVLDMGKPVRIMDLAHDLITLSGQRPGHDIEIQTIGLRPGEKLTEELLDGDGEPLRTVHPRICAVHPQPTNPAELERLLRLLAERVDAWDQEGALDALWQLVESRQGVDVSLPGS